MSKERFRYMTGIQPSLRHNAWGEAIIQRVYLTACDNVIHPSIWRRVKIWWWLRTLKREYGDSYYDRARDKVCAATSLPRWKRCCE